MKLPVPLTLCLAIVSGCGEARPADASIDAAGAPDGGRHDAAASPDAGSLDASTDDAGRTLDGGSLDAASPDGSSSDSGSRDAASPDAGSPEAGRDGGVDAGSDAGTPARSDHHIHIDVDNFCAMTLTPTSITIPAGQTAYFDWHNHSNDYAVDVWMSYGGGYTDLPPYATWDEPIGHCIGPTARTEYADISTACSSYRFPIHCL